MIFLVCVFLFLPHYLLAWTLEGASSGAKFAAFFVMYFVLLPPACYGAFALCFPGKEAPWDAKAEAPLECLSCRSQMPEDADTCAECGWTSKAAPQHRPAAPFAFAAMGGRIQPLRFRLCTPEDYGACEAIYMANEPEHVPAGYLSDFKMWMRDGTALVLVAESEGVVVACCGVNYHRSLSSACLSYGIVHPDHHGKGFGITLLAARLALLEPDSIGCAVTITVTEMSVRFFVRFGFLRFGATTDERGVTLGHYHVQITESDAARCRDLLAQAGATLPEGCEIPIVQV